MIKMYFHLRYRKILTNVVESAQAELVHALKVYVESSEWPID